MRRTRLRRLPGTSSIRRPRGQPGIGFPDYRSVGARFGPAKRARGAQKSVKPAVVRERRASLPEPNACSPQEISMPTTVPKRSPAVLANHFDLASFTDITLFAGLGLALSLMCASYELDLSAALF
jgi:hypothetical protein